MDCSASGQCGRHELGHIDTQTFKAERLSESRWWFPSLLPALLTPCPVRLLVSNVNSRFCAELQNLSAYRHHGVARTITYSRLTLSSALWAGQMSAGGRWSQQLALSLLHFWCRVLSIHPRLSLSFNFNSSFILLHYPGSSIWTQTSQSTWVPKPVPPADFLWSVCRLCQRAVSISYVGFSPPTASMLMEIRQSLLSFKEHNRAVDVLSVRVFNLSFVLRSTANCLCPYSGNMHVP